MTSIFGSTDSAADRAMVSTQDPVGAGGGVYFLANDVMFDMVVAFLNSFRHHHPCSKLCLIPYDDQFDQIASLKHHFEFSVFDDQEQLNRCDAISVRFHGKIKGAYRKLCAWSGPFERFAYIDADTVLQCDLRFAFAELGAADIVTSSSHLADNLRWVWKPSVVHSHLSGQQIEFAASTGFIVSRRGALEFDWILNQVDSAVALKEHMVLKCMEQPFLNYLIVTSGRRYTSLLQLVKSGARPHLPLEFWAGSTAGVLEDGRLRYASEQPIFLLHWAGGWRKHASLTELPNKELWLKYRNAHPAIPSFE